MLLVVLLLAANYSNYSSHALLCDCAHTYIFLAAFLHTRRMQAATADSLFFCFYVDTLFYVVRVSARGTSYAVTANQR
jgi:hypothetical protein